MADAVAPGSSTPSVPASSSSVIHDSSDAAVPSVSPSSPSSSSSSTTTPAASVSTPSSPSRPAAEKHTAGHKHDLDDKTTEELVDIEKKKVRTIYTLIEEVKKDTTALNELIVEAKESKDVEARKEMIDEIKHAAADVQEKVLTAAVLNSDVKELTAALQEKKAAEAKQDA